MPALNAFSVLTPERVETPVSSLKQNVDPIESHAKNLEYWNSGATLDIGRELLKQNPDINAIFSLILPFLKPLELLKMTEVSKKTREVACADSLWGPVLSYLGVNNNDAMAYAYFNSLGCHYAHISLSGTLESQAKELDKAQNFLRRCAVDDNKVEAEQMALQIRALGAAAEGFENGDQKLLNDAVAAFKVWNDSELLVDLFLDTLNLKLEGTMDPSGALSQQLEESFKALFERLRYAHSSCKALPFEGVWEAVQNRAVTVVAKEIHEIIEKSQYNEQCYWEAVPNLFQTIVRGVSQLQDIGISRDFMINDIAQGLLIPYLESQVMEFRRLSSEQVDKWSENVFAQEDAKEKRIWSHVPKKAEKKNFINSFMNAFSTASAVESDPSVSEETSRKVLQGTAGPKTYFEAQTAVLASRLEQIDSLVSIDVTIKILDDARKVFRRLKQLDGLLSDHQLIANTAEEIFTTTLDVLCWRHIRTAFSRALHILQEYDPKQHGRLLVEDGEQNSAVEPLAIYAEMVHVADIVQQMIHALFEKELVESGYVRSNDFGAPSVTAKRKFEHMLDDNFAEGLNRGINILMEQVEFVLVTEQLGSDYNPTPGPPPQIGPTAAAKRVVSLVNFHLHMLHDSIERHLFDVFQEEVGLRLYTSLGKHLKRQTISLDGAITVISDINYYYEFALSLRQRAIYPYYEALKQVAQLYLIDTHDAKQIGRAINDISRFKGMITTDELLEFVQSRKDWTQIRSKVERVLYGFTECIIV